MGKTWLNYFNLSDSYERKARFLPALLSVFPLLPAAFSFGVPLCDWIRLVIVGTGLGAVAAVALSHIASVFGNRIQSKIWPDWPHDAPTNQWLHPDEDSISNQQKKLWYEAIKRLIQLDIQQAVDTNDPDMIKTIINDAIKALRSFIWKTPEAERAQMHNIDYGFARNLTGLRPIWGAFAIISVAACWFNFMHNDTGLFWAVVSTIFAIGALMLGFILPGYVKRKAEYYAESFFGAVVNLSKNVQPSKAETK